jgi:5-methyltetrahydrofolate--homocysteine methyltransferase
MEAIMSSEFRKAMERGGIIVFDGAVGTQLTGSAGIIIFDGAMGTQLTARGAVSGPAANVNAPEIVLAVHRAYREAGADVLMTNTLTASRPALARSGEADELPRYVSEACKLTRQALGGSGYVAGDVGPTGELLEPYGTMTEDAMRAAFEEVARLLAAGGVDLFVVETMSDVREVTLAVQACRAAARDLPIAATMSFDPSRRGGFRTNMGVSPTEAGRAMIAAGADIIGANCGSVTPGQMAEIVREFRRATPGPILIQANAGVPELQAGKTIFRLSPEEFADGMKRVLDAGAQLVGGCCGTTPEHIRRLRQAVDGKRETRR